MQQLWQSGSSATLILAGSVVEPSNVERVYESLPEEHRTRIRRLGLVSGQLKQDLLAATDVFVLPSRVDSFGIVYLEAWAYGVPVIGCRAGGVPDVIDDSVDGVLIDFGDVPALANAIEALLAAPEHRQAMGQAGRAKIEAHYTWEHIYTKLLAVYEELVG